MRLRINPQLKEKIQESMAAVLPITAIVLVLSITVAPLEPGALVLFLFGAILLIAGMGFFTLGVDISMIPMGDAMGGTISKSRSRVIPLLICFVLGALTTIAEPDLQVLARQVASIDTWTLVLTVAAGVGFFLALAALRIRCGVPLRALLLVLYAITFGLAFLAPGHFIPVSFDAGGVTTGPITVPFIMALGVGIASSRTDKNASSDSFGLISLCSIGPILMVLLLGVIYQPAPEAQQLGELPQVETTATAANAFLHGIPDYLKEVAIALLPILGMFLVYQIVTRKFRRGKLLKMGTGLAYTYIGLTLFLTGANVGFMPAGQLIGATVAGGARPWLLIPIGMLIGYYIVKAEPAVRVLTVQVEEVSNGSITQKSMQLALSVGVCVSVGLAMLRVLTGLNIFWLLIPGYGISLALSFFVPPIFTGIAFDSGGVASGPMTAAFLLPFAMGACSAAGGDMAVDAFGIVSMVAMTPLVTIQVMGIAARILRSVKRRQLRYRLDKVEDCIAYLDSKEVAGHV